MNSYLEQWNKKKTDKEWLIPFIILHLWTLDAFISIFTQSFWKFDVYSLIALLIKVAVIVLNIFFIRQLFIKENRKLYGLFKTYSGYGIVAVYVIYSLPRMAWETQGFISSHQVLGLWVLTFISTLFPFLLYLTLYIKKTQVYWKHITKKEAKDKKLRKLNEKKAKKTLGAKILANVDVVVQAIILVIIIQHFVFQMYMIPTESMVPTFLAGERPLVLKLPYGPTIPLTNIHLPRFAKINRGDIMTLKNPLYPKQSVFRRIVGPFLFYVTLSTVNINQNINGQTIPDPLVKRMIGLPGDKVMMVNDVVYIKTAKDKEFNKFTIDTEKYAHVNLQTEPLAIRKQIKQLGITDFNRKILNHWDQWEQRTTLGEIKMELDNQKMEFDLNYKRIKGSQKDWLFNKIITPAFENHQTLDTVKQEWEWLKLQPQAYRLKAYQDPNLIMAFKDKRNVHLTQLYSNLYFSYQDLIYFYDILMNKESYASFKEFLSGMDHIPSTYDDFTLYEINGMKINWEWKLLLLKRFNRYLHMALFKKTWTQLLEDSAFKVNDQNFQELRVYLEYYEYRNFNAFPREKDHYIPKGQYFLMGDNRYNSYDFRFRGDYYYNYKAMDSIDPHSLSYLTKEGPRTLPEENIRGIVAARVWPLNRFKIFLFQH